MRLMGPALCMQVKKAAADERSDWYPLRIVSVLGEGRISVDSRPVSKGYPTGMVCQWQFSRPSSDLELSFEVWDPDGGAVRCRAADFIAVLCAHAHTTGGAAPSQDKVDLFAGTAPAADQLALSFAGGDSAPTATIYNGTEWLLRFRAGGGHTAVGQGLHVHYLFHRTWYVGPPELVGQDHRIGVWSAPVGSVWEAVRRASHMDTIVLYPGKTWLRSFHRLLAFDTARLYHRPLCTLRYRRP